MNNTHLKHCIGAALMAAVMAILSQFSIPIGSIPITLQTFVSALAGTVLGRKWGAAGIFLWVFIGVIGVPVFANGKSGPGVVLGPTGGYLFGLVLMAYICGWIAEKDRAFWKQCLIAIAGLAADYILGTAAFILYFQYGLGKVITLGAALSMAVIPFIPFDIVKVIIAVFAGLKVKRALQAAGYQK